MYTQNVTLNVIPEGVRPVIYCSQYDNHLQAIRFTLYKQGELFEIPNYAAVVINGHKPDNTAFSYDATSVSGSTAVFSVTQQMTAVAGDVLCELRVRTPDEIIGTINFILCVEPAPLSDDSVMSETEIPLVEQAIDIAANLAQYIQQTVTARDEAIAAATRANSSATSAATDAASAASDAGSVLNLYNSIETAKQNANTAAQNANNAAATIANISAVATTLAPGSNATASYNNGVLTLGIPRGLTGDNGVSVTTSGIFWLEVDDNGDLYANYNDTVDPPSFDYESDTGNLYYLVGSVRALVSGLSPLTITEAEADDALSLYFTLLLTQDGTGTPSPTNARAINTTDTIEYAVNGVDVSETLSTALVAGTYSANTKSYTMTHKTKTFSSTSTWSTYMDSNGHIIFQSTIDDMDASTTVNDGLCNILDYDRALSSNYTYALARQTVSVRCDDASTVDDFKTWLRTNTLTFAYKLATPIKPTGGSYSIALLAGSNTITTNWDSITVEYIKQKETE